MKTPLLCVLLAFTTSATLHADPALEAFKQGRQAYYAGDWKAAADSLSTISSTHSAWPQASAMLNDAKTKLASQPDDTLRKKLDSVVVKNFKLEEASVTDALTLLKKQISETGDKNPVNFIVRPGLSEATSVTLDLSDIPASEVLRYICESVGATAKFDKHAIFVAPAAGAAKAAASGETKEKAD